MRKWLGLLEKRVEPVDVERMIETFRDFLRSPREKTTAKSHTRIVAIDPGLKGFTWSNPWVSFELLEPYVGIPKKPQTIAVTFQSEQPFEIAEALSSVLSLVFLRRVTSVDLEAKPTPDFENKYWRRYRMSGIEKAWDKGDVRFYVEGPIEAEPYLSEEETKFRFQRLETVLEKMAQLNQDDLSQFVRFCRTYQQALFAGEEDRSIGYSLLCASVETLMPDKTELDEGEREQSQLMEQVRAILNREQVSQEVSEKVLACILSNERFLKRRFVAFFRNNLDDSFFDITDPIRTEEYDQIREIVPALDFYQLVDQNRGIPKLKVDDAISKTYDLRSKSLHEGMGIPYFAQRKRFEQAIKVIDKKGKPSLQSSGPDYEWMKRSISHCGLNWLSARGSK